MQRRQARVRAGSGRQTNGHASTLHTRLLPPPRHPPRAEPPSRAAGGQQRACRRPCPLPRAHRSEWAPGGRRAPTMATKPPSERLELLLDRNGKLAAQCEVHRRRVDELEKRCEGGRRGAGAAAAGRAAAPMGLEGARASGGERTVGRRCPPDTLPVRAHNCFAGWRGMRRRRTSTRCVCVRGGVGRRGGALARALAVAWRGACAPRRALPPSTPQDPPSHDPRGGPQETLLCVNRLWDELNSCTAFLRYRCVGGGVAGWRLAGQESQLVALLKLTHAHTHATAPCSAGRGVSWRAPARRTARLLTLGCWSAQTPFLQSCWACTWGAPSPRASPQVCGGWGGWAGHVTRARVQPG